MKDYMSFYKNGTIDHKAYLAYLKNVMLNFQKYFIPDESKENGGPDFILNRSRIKQGDFSQISLAYSQLLSEIERQINEDTFDADLLTTMRQTLAERWNTFNQQLDEISKVNLEYVSNRTIKEIEEGDSMQLSELVDNSGISLWKRQATVSDDQFEKDSMNEMQPMGQNEPLFPEGSPNKNDVLQDTSGTCFMLSGLRTLAEYDPEYIKSRMIDNGDNTVTVYFQSFGPVTVDKSYPKNVDKDAAPWVRIIEKAYVAAHLKTQDRRFREIPQNEYHMKNMLWGQESAFMGAFMPMKEVMNQYDLFTAPNRNEARRQIREALISAKDKKPTIVIGTALHAISVEGITEKDGKVYLNLYDQWKRKSETVDVDTLLNDDPKYKTLFFVNNAGELPHEYIYFDTGVTAGNFKIYEEPAKEETFVADLSKKFRIAIKEKMVFDQPLSQEEMKQMDSYLRNSVAIQNILKQEFSKLEPGITVGQTDWLMKKGSPYLKETLGKLVKGVINELQKNENPTLTRLKENLSQPEKIKQTFAELTTTPPEDKKPSPRTEEEMVRLAGKLGGIYSKQEKERISRFGKNSVEFVAMTDALRDLYAVMWNPNADKKVVKILQERAYIKCNYYQKNKNPKSPYGIRRKNAALEAMKAIEEMNPTVATDIYSKKGKEMLVEMACMCAKKEMEPEMNQYKTPMDSIQNMGRLNDEIQKFMDNPVLQKLGESIKYSGSENREMFEKLCQKEPREALRDFMSRKVPGVSLEWHNGELTDEHVERTFNVKLESNPEPEMKM